MQVKCSYSYQSARRLVQGGHSESPVEKADLEAQEDLQHGGGYITDSDDGELDAHLVLDDAV